MPAAGVSVKIMTINMSDNKNSSAQDRRKNVQDIINRYGPDIIFAQEISAPRKTKWKLKIDDRYKTQHTEKEAGVAAKEEKKDPGEVGKMEKSEADAVAKMNELSVKDNEHEESSDAGIMYDLTFISEFDMAAKHKIVEKMSQMKDGKGDQVWQSDALDDLSARTCIVCIQCDDKYVLAISWHGKWKATDDVKIRTFYALMAFALLVRKENKKENTSIIIGGDFNLKNLSDMEIKNHEFKLVKYDAKMARRSEEELVDFFLHTKEIQVTNAKVLNVPKDSKNQVYLDHDPISAEIRFVSSSGEE